MDEVAALEAACFSLPWSRRLFEEELKHPDLSSWVVARAEAGGPILGYAGWWKAGQEAHLVNLAVGPARRRQGLGRELARRVLEDARALGCTEASLEVRAGNVAAQQLYWSLGFTTAAVRPKYYSDNGEDALILWKNPL